MTEPPHPFRAFGTLFRGLWSAVNDPGLRLLMVMTLTVVGGGAAFYSFVEGWGWIDSLYFATVTIATVGYGDFAPQTDTGKLFTVVYIVTGLGLFVAMASALADHLIRRANEEANARLEHHRNVRRKRKEPVPPSPAPNQKTDNRN